MTKITLKLSSKEIELLCSLASDQLFRREFIDSRLPGFKSSASDLSLGKQLVERLKVQTDRVKRAPLPRRDGTAI
jgi:hypothetical protein